MSLLASFYLLSEDKAKDLILAADAQLKALNQKRWFFFKPQLPLNPDPFWSFLQANAKELDDFPYSGTLLLDLDAIASGILDSKHLVGDKLSEITKSTFLSYGPNEAEFCTRILRSLSLSDTLISNFLQEEGRGENPSEYKTALSDASNIALKWFESIKKGQIGLLSIG